MAAEINALGQYRSYIAVYQSTSAIGQVTDCYPSTEHPAVQLSNHRPGLLGLH